MPASYAPRTSGLPRAALMAILLIASRCAGAAPFEFVGLSRATTQQEVVKRYANSMQSGSIFRISPKDSHDHVFAIELAEGSPAGRLRVAFGSPENRYPACDAIERSIAARHGAPAEARAFREESTENRVAIWNLEGETVQLQCFRAGGSSAKYFAEALTVYPLERASSEPRRSSRAAAQR